MGLYVNPGVLAVSLPDQVGRDNGERGGACLLYNHRQNIASKKAGKTPQQNTLADQGKKFPGFVQHIGGHASVTRGEEKTGKGGVRQRIRNPDFQACPPRRQYEVPLNRA